MNPAHLHLLINHLPVLGSVLGAFVLGYGLFTNSYHTRKAGYYLLVLAAVGGLVTYFSGEGAEEIVEHVPGVSHDTIEAHEDFAKFALIALILLGVSAVAGLFMQSRNPEKDRSFARIVLVLAFISFAVAGYTGQLGGQIRHTEVHDPAAATGHQAPEPTELDND